MHMATLWHCMWGRGLRGNNDTCLALSWLSVTSSATHKQIGSFWCWFLGWWVCVHSRTLWVSPTNSPVRLRVSPATSTPMGFFIQEVLRLCFLVLEALETWVVWSVSLPSCSFWLIRTQMWDHLLCQPPTCPKSSLPRLPISIPPTGLDECFLFNSLVVRLQYSLICRKFWLFFVFKCVVVLLLVVRWGTVYLPMPHLGWKS